MAAERSTNLVIVLMVMSMALFLVAANAGKDGWNSAHATFYGDMRGTGTMKGACGYGNLLKSGYGLEIAALSTALFDKGLTCGACYEIQCIDSKYCLNDTIQVTATDSCPDKGWCSPPNKHFDLSQPMFGKISKYEAGVVPIIYRKVHCVKTGGMKFVIKGNTDWVTVLVYNVGGAGDVHDVKIKGSNTNWIQLSKDWGQNWQTRAELVGQSLSFRVTSSDGRMVQSDNAAPADWKFRHAYEGKQFLD